MPCFIGFNEADAEFPEASWLAGSSTTRPLRCGVINQTGHIAAARAGFGIAMLPHFLAAGDPALVEVRLSKAPPTRELWLLTRRIRVVADFLLDLILRERSLFEGT